MIALFTGKPGSGKSYKVVEKLLGIEKGKYYVFHNIDGLKETLIEDGHYIKQWPAIPNFLSYTVQEELQQEVREKYNRNMLVIIDEAKVHGFGEKNKEKASWLAYHRHWGQEIWLIAQTAKMLHMDYTELAEYECRAKRVGIMGMHVYQYSQGGEVYSTERSKAKKAIFMAYRSFEGEKGKEHTNRVLAIAGVLIILLVGMLYYFFKVGVPGLFGGAPVQAATRDHVKAAPLQAMRQNVSKLIPKEVKASPVKRELPCEVGYSYVGVLGDRVLLQDMQTDQIMSLTLLHPEATEIVAWSNGCKLKEKGKLYRYSTQRRAAEGGPGHPEEARRGL